MNGAIHPFPQYAFMAWCLVKHRDNFTFLPFTGVNRAGLTIETVSGLILTAVTNIEIKNKF
jgi:hypothetical protein